MAELPHPWDAYASVDSTSPARTAVGDRSWGFEAALNRLVISRPPDPAQLAMVQASAERGARYGRALVARNVAALNSEAPSADAQMEARSDLIFLAAIFPRRTWPACRPLALAIRRRRRPPVSGWPARAAARACC